MIEASRRPGRRAWALLAILAVAATLRCAALSSLPPAHYRDIAVTALDALRAASGHPRLHFVYDEGLYADLMGIVFKVAGASDLTVRLQGALFGVLTCLAVYRLGRSLGAPRAGLCGAFLMAVSLWHVILSRSGFRAVMLPMLMSFGFALLVEGLRERRTGRMAAAGILFGLCAHTYPPSRVVPLLIPIAVVAVLGAERARWARAAPGLVVLFLAAAAVASPMLLHYLHHPEDFNNPQRIVSIFSPELEPGAAGSHVRANLLATLLMFHAHGDDNWRHNIAGAPLLDPLTGLLFVIGLGAAVLMLRGGFERHTDRPRTAAVLLLAWVPVMLIPNVLSVEGVPHALRSCGALPAIMLLAGFGAAILAEVVLMRWGRRTALVLALTAAAALAALTGYRYFVVWGRDVHVGAEHDGAYRAAARVLLAAPPEAGRFLIANGTGFDLYGHPAETQPYLFEMRAGPPVVIGPKDSARLVLGGRPAMVALIRRDERILARIRALNPGAPVSEVVSPGLSSDSPVFRIN